MIKYTVIIPTTNYVVGINDIVKEDPLVSSVICENNNLEALPISSFYNSFVKSPTGPLYLQKFFQLYYLFLLLSQLLFFHQK